MIKIRLAKLIPSVTALILSWIFWGWKAALVVFLLSIDGAPEDHT